VLDYSTTISDTGALLYLASHPDVELLAVTLPGTGEADCGPGTRTTRALLVLADNPDVPVACGRDEPLAGDRDWPTEWRDLANRFPGVILPSVADAPVGNAEQLLVDTLTRAAEPVTLVAVGPLTNLAVVLDSRPDLADRVDRIVVMGGAVDVPGNVAAALDAEWNLYVDPEAARRVIASGVPVLLVPLDATNAVPWTDKLVRQLGTLGSSAGRAEHQLVASRDSLDAIFLWDELAAVVAVRPQTVTIEHRMVAIADTGAIRDDPMGRWVEVAVATDVPTVEEEFLSVLNGGPLPKLEPLTDAESTYLAAVTSAHARFEATLVELYSSSEVATTEARPAAERFVTTFWRALATLEADLREMAVPATLVELHTGLVDVIGVTVSRGDEVLAAVAGAEGTETWELLDNAANEVGSEDELFGPVSEACVRIEDYSVLRDGPAFCDDEAGG
jgi:pyrimidine-specific ribonucleoside hydrolase